MTTVGKPKCLNCGRPLKQAHDTIAKKKTPYNWKCKCMPKVQISIG